MSRSVIITLVRVADGRFVGRENEMALSGICHLGGRADFCKFWTPVRMMSETKHVLFESFEHILTNLGLMFVCFCFF